MEQGVEQRLRALKRVPREPPFDHQCVASQCNPQNERMLTRMTRGDQRVYLCDAGAIHVCEPGLCRLGARTIAGDIVCPVTGMIVGVHEQLSVPHDATPHWKVIHTPATPVKPVSTLSVASPDVVEKKCRDMIHKLFFSDVRAQINDRWTRERTDRCSARIDRYVLEQRKQRAFISLSEIMLIRSNELGNGKPYAILVEKDHTDVVDACVRVVRQVWERLVCQFYGEDELYKDALGAPIRPAPDYIILGVLYMMKSGHRQQQTVLIPYNEFVARNIPSEKDLKHFGYIIGRLKPGKDLLMLFFQQAIRMNIHVDL